MSRLDSLNREVTAAILELEAAERKVSHFEEEIARLTAPASAEGRAARRGAIRAAVAGKDEKRARALVSRFVAEEGADVGLRGELEAFFQ
jgi:hypothetical protein